MIYRSWSTRFQDLVETSHHTKQYAYTLGSIEHETKKELNEVVIYKDFLAAQNIEVDEFSSEKDLKEDETLDSILQIMFYTHNKFRKGHNHQKQSENKSK